MQYCTVIWFRGKNNNYFSIYHLLVSKKCRTTVLLSENNHCDEANNIWYLISDLTSAVRLILISLEKTVIK